MNNLKEVNPTKPVAPYIGGKMRLAQRLIALINQTPHKAYAEPFIGMGGVFLRRNMRPRAEFINDYSKEVANLFRILQRHYPQFLDMLKFQICTRTEFSRLTKTDPNTLTDLERAARFLYLQKTAFGGKPSGQSFGVSKGEPAHFDLSKLVPMLEDVHERLSGVTIECLPWQDFIKRYDHNNMLFYLDPPYYGGENDYGKDMFGRDEYQEMADILSNIKGRFILSINNVEPIREIFKDFAFDEVELNYSVSKGTSTPAKELIITGNK